jgi:hypothetical protein
VASPLGRAATPSARDAVVQGAGARRELRERVRLQAPPALGLTSKPTTVSADMGGWGGKVAPRGTGMAAHRHRASLGRYRGRSRGRGTLKPHQREGSGTQWEVVRGDGTKLAFRCAHRWETRLPRATGLASVASVTLSSGPLWPYYDRGGEGGIRTPVAQRALGLQPSAIVHSATSPGCRGTCSLRNGKRKYSRADAQIQA